MKCKISWVNFPQCGEAEAVGYARTNHASHDVDKRLYKGQNFVWSEWFPICEHHRKILVENLPSWHFLSLKDGKLRNALTLGGNLQWTEQGMKKLNEIITLLDAHFGVIQQTRNYAEYSTLLRIYSEFYETLQMLGDYGGVVNDGIKRELPTFSEYDSLEYRKAMLAIIEKHNSEPKDLTKTNIVEIGWDFASLTLGLTWKRLSGKDYVPYMYGVMTCHAFSNGKFISHVGDANWGIHT